MQPARLSCVGTSMSRSIWAVLVATTVAGCGATSATRQATAPATNDVPAAAQAGEGRGAAAVPREVIQLEPIRIEVVTAADGTRTSRVTDARDLLDAGNAALAEGRYEDALARYDELVGDFPSSRLVEPALYNSGLAHEGLEQIDAALARYRAVVQRGGTGRDPLDALIRSAALTAELERWTAAAGVLDELLARDDLEPSDRVEGLARLGYVLLESKAEAESEQVLRSALAYANEVRDGAGLRTDYYVAMAQYYLAQIPHRRFLARPIRLPDRQIKVDIEAKSEQILLAHDRYIDTVDVGDRYWAGAAGYQLASMYRQFWDALVRAPVPPEITGLGDKAVALYNRRVHDAARQFLEKAAGTHETNVEHADAAGYKSAWVEASRRSARRIRDILARERAGELVVPDAEDTSTLPDLPAVAPAAYAPGRYDL